VKKSFNRALNEVSVHDACLLVNKERLHHHLFTVEEGKGNDPGIFWRVNYAGKERRATKYP
jgi:hypothetical protein